MEKLKCRVLFMALVLALMAGCATSGKTNQLQLGMSKAQVLEVMGEPSCTSAMGEVVLLKYRLFDYGLLPENYFIKIIDGSVEAYGCAADFDLGY